MACQGKWCVWEHTDPVSLRGKLHISQIKTANGLWQTVMMQAWATKTSRAMDEDVSLHRVSFKLAFVMSREWHLVVRNSKQQTHRFSSYAGEHCQFAEFDTSMDNLMKSLYYLIICAVQPHGLWHLLTMLKHLKKKLLPWNYCNDHFKLIA